VLNGSFILGYALTLFYSSVLDLENIKELGNQFGHYKHSCQEKLMCRI